ncbi:MAG: efflux RND transporter permease subunit [Myxococcales bacterium]|nr:efflux RND transporter permease subunit [Myxococcales bacterium]
MASEHEAREEADERRWEALIGFFVANKLVVFILAAVVAVLGLVFAPFAWELGSLPRDPIAVDALPDTGENQQIVFTEWPGRSPRDVEDQITYPLTTALLGVPGIKTVRGISMFGFSSIYVIFEDEIEFYWSRSRVLEKLASLPRGTLPEGAAPTLGPDATALGQVFWYTLEPRDADGEVVGGAFDLDELRSIQDYNVRYALQAVPGVAEVASIGGFVREYQVDVDPQAMQAMAVSLGEIAGAVRKANLDVGARTLEINGAEYMIRGLGFIESTEDLEEVVVAAREHTPIRVKDVARVGLGPALRAGVLDSGGAEAVGGVVVVRYGENPLAVIDRVKAKIAEIGHGLPSREVDGRRAQVTLVPFYDRTGLIHETLATLSSALIQQVLITIAVILIILRHLPSSLLVSMVLPLGVLTTFVLMRLGGVDANVMALGGIAIAIGTMVDVGIVFTENIVQHLDEAPPGGWGERAAIVRRAAGEVAAAVFTSITTTVLAFLPIFGLTGPEGKLFAPLAYTKTFALIAAFLVALVVLPAIAHLVLRGRGQRLGRPHLLDLAIAGIGVLALASGALGAGLALLTIGGVRLAGPRLPRALAWLPAALTNGIAGVFVVYTLVKFWMPLGPGHSLADNLVFVGLVVGPLALLFLGFQRVYRRLLALCLDHKVAFLALNLAIVLTGALSWLGGERVVGALPEGLRGPLAGALTRAFPGLRDDLMPPFDEGSFLFMPTTTPHASVGEARAMLSEMDAAIAAIPEVSEVVGKIGRAESPLDPAPLSMFEVVVNYVPEYRKGPDGELLTFRYDEARGDFVRDDEGELVPDPEGRPFRLWRDEIREPDDIWREIARVGRVPGVTGAPELMPIKTRLVMLQTGMRSALGLKIRGPDLETIERFGLRLEAELRTIPEVNPESVVADRIVGKPYLEIELDRPAIARHGLTVVDVQDLLQIALGGEVLTRTVEGRERYPVRVRYMREERDSLEALQRILVSAPSGEQIPLEQLASIRYVRGPQMIRAEDTFLTGYVTFDAARGIGEIEAMEAVGRHLDAAIADGSLVIPEGASRPRLAGTYENQVRTQKRLVLLVPLALAITFVLMYLQFRRVGTTLLVFSGSLISASGGFILLWLYGQEWFMAVAPLGFDLQQIFQVAEVKVTVAVWVGFLALFGVDTDNGVIMATYLSQRFRGAAPASRAEVRALVIEAAERRVRPCLMTTATTLIALLPVLTSRGRGADLMIPMAIPVVGGISMAMITLLTVPVVFGTAREIEWWRTRRGVAAGEGTPPRG